MTAIHGNATHQAALLAVMATGNGGSLTIDQLDATLPIGRKQIATAAARLIQRAYVERAETGVYRLTLTGRKALEDGVSLTSGPHRKRRKYPVLQDTLRQRAWKAMRLNTRFTVPDIVTLAARDTDGDAEGNIRRFCHQLVRCGYLAQLPGLVRGNKETSPGFACYRLLRDTGDAAPQYRAKDRGFYDRNTREVFPCA